MELITLNELGILTPTKENIKVVSQQLAEMVLNGNYSPVEFAVRTKFIIECFDDAMKLIKNDLTESVREKTTYLGASIEPTETGVKYDYSTNANWLEYENRIEPLRTKQKEIEEQIKMATKIGKSIIDEKSGEVIASPVEKSSTSSVKITLSK